MMSSTTNPIWNRYINMKLEEWLTWIANHSLEAHMALLSKFILANPYYIPDFEKGIDLDDFFIRMVYDETYLSSLSDKGLTVWYNSDFHDFLQSLMPYTIRNKDLRKIYDFLIKYIWWFDRQYSVVRKHLSVKFEAEGRSFK